MEKKRILICGAGCIGTYLGTLLYSKGFDIELLGRRKLKETSDKININGKTYEMPEKIFKLPKNEKFDFIFITTKLYDFENIINQINKNKIKTNFLASIQNGLVDNSKYKKMLHHKLVPITVFYGIKFDKNGIVARKTSMGWKTEDSKEGRIISKIISETGINCTAEKKFDSYRAEKTIVNSTLNALSAIENKPFYELFKNPKTKERIDALFNECYNILKNEHKLSSPIIIKKRLYKEWSKMPHYSSTCQDLKSGRKTEVNFFNGYMINLGKKHNQSTLENQKIIEDFQKISKK